MTNAEIICTYCLDDLFFNSVSAQWTNKLMKVITTFSHPNSCIVAGNWLLSKIPVTYHANHCYEQV